MSLRHMLQAKDSGFFDAKTIVKDAARDEAHGQQPETCDYRAETSRISLLHSPTPTPTPSPTAVPCRDHEEQKPSSILKRRMSTTKSLASKRDSHPLLTTTITAESPDPASSHVYAGSSCKLRQPPPRPLTLTLAPVAGATSQSPPRLPSPSEINSPRERVRPPPVSLVEHAHILSGDLPFLRHEYRPPTTPAKRKTSLKPQQKELDNTSPLARRGSLPSISLPSRGQPGSDSRTGDARNLSRSKSRSLATLNMARLPPQLPGSHDDIFLELANDGMATRDDSATLRHSRLHSDKRRSMTSNEAPRPRTSGSIYARTSPQTQNMRASIDLMRQSKEFRSSSQLVDTTNSLPRDHDARSRRHTQLSELSPLSPSRLARRPRSPESSQNRRRQLSIGGGAAASSARQQQAAQFTSSMYDFQDDSVNEDVIPNGPESASTVSESAETVWDELDELKSRIKRLELSGKPPALSSAAISGGSSGDRPRTATTAPTTINSSPKQDRKVEPENDKATSTASPEAAATTPSGSNIHPMLHQALAKAKPLLNPALYRSLDATATDALQLAAMTGSAGPHGTTYSAASFMNGMGFSDRNVRRKADNMCRNLTDLCLALCEGKHEIPRTPVSQPSTESVAQRSSLQSRATLRPSINTNIRPMSRLEARRSSILGSSPPSEAKSSPRGSFVELPSYDQDETLTQNFYQRSHRGLRSSLGSGVARRRTQQVDDISGTDEEEVSARPVSRAATEVGGFRTRSRVVSEDRPPMPSLQRSPALREALLSQRNNQEAYASNRVSSFGSEQRMVPEQRLRRNVYDEQVAPATPEEENNVTQYHPSSRPPQRVTSLGRFSSRRAAAETQGQGQGRSPGLQQRRHVIVE